MFCQECGFELKDDVKFCTNCGKAVATKSKKVTTSQVADKPVNKELINLEKPQTDIKSNSNNDINITNGKKISNNITLYQDGKYRWVYEMSLFKNPTIFWLIWKIFFFIILGFIIFASVLGTFDNILDCLKSFGYFVGGMTLLSGIGYLIYALIMGGKYIVIFEMDEEGVNHKQCPQQAKKAEALAMLNRYGMLIRTEMYSEFSKVREVKAYPKTNVIKVNGLLEHNQVYAENEDFDFVLNFIKEQISKKSKEYKA